LDWPRRHSHGPYEVQGNWILGRAVNSSWHESLPWDNQLISQVHRGILQYCFIVDWLVEKGKSMELDEEEKLFIWRDKMKICHYSRVDAARHSEIIWNENRCIKCFHWRGFNIRETFGFLWEKKVGISRKYIPCWWEGDECSGTLFAYLETLLVGKSIFHEDKQHCNKSLCNETKFFTQVGKVKILTHRIWHDHWVEVEHGQCCHEYLEKKGTTCCPKGGRGGVSYISGHSYSYLGIFAWKDKERVGAWSHDKEHHGVGEGRKNIEFLATPWNFVLWGVNICP